MADVQVQRVSIVASPAGKKKVAKGANKSSPKSKKSTPNHPATAAMVTSAIASLKERGGSSLQAIKKQIATTYKIDVNKLSPFIKKYIKNAVSSGKLIQTKGKGVSGSFKLSVLKNEKKSATKKIKATTEPKSKSVAEKKKTVKSVKKGKSLEKKSKKTSSVKKPVPKKTAKPKTVSKSKVAKKPIKKTKVDKKTPSPKKSVK